MWEQGANCKAAAVVERLVRLSLLHRQGCSHRSRPMNVKNGFKKPGKDGMNIYRAVLISGAPGIGKTTSAHLVAQMEGYTPIELNASDTRSKKLIEVAWSITL
jgi:DNA polymerase III delta prime subunit